MSTPSRQRQRPATSTAPPTTRPRSHLEHLQATRASLTSPLLAALIACSFNIFARGCSVAPSTTTTNNTVKHTATRATRAAVGCCTTGNNAICSKLSSYSGRENATVVTARARAGRSDGGWRPSHTIIGQGRLSIGRHQLQAVVCRVDRRCHRVRNCLKAVVFGVDLSSGALPRHVNRLCTALHRHGVSVLMPVSSPVLAKRVSPSQSRGLQSGGQPFTTSLNQELASHCEYSTTLHHHQWYRRR